MRPADAGHGAESFGDQQHAVALARVHGIHGNYGVAAIGAIQIERLNQEQLATLVTGMLLGRDHFTDNARDEHGSEVDRIDDPHDGAVGRDFRR